MPVGKVQLENLMRLGITKGMIDSHGSGVGWNFLALFQVGATRAVAFLF